MGARKLREVSRICMLQKAISMVGLRKVSLEVPSIIEGRTSSRRLPGTALCTLPWYPMPHTDCNDRVRSGALHRGWAGVLLCVALGGSAYSQAQIPSGPVPQGAATQPGVEAAQRQMAAGDFKGAAAALSKEIAGGMGSAAAHAMLAYCDLRLDDPRKSLEEYTKAAAIEKPSAVDLQNVAKDYVLLGDTASAEHWMMVAVQMNDRDPEAWYGLGRIRFTMQHFQEAADCFERSLVLLPRNSKVENNLGLAYEGLNRTDDAIAAYRKAIEWQQKEEHPSEQPLLNLGIILLHQEKLTEAESLLTQAVAIAPHDPRIREQLGHLYLQLNRLPEAQQQLEEAIAQEPKASALHFLLGKVYHLEGQEVKAKLEFKVAAELSGYHSTPETE